MLKYLAFVVLVLVSANVFAQDGNSAKERFEASFGRGLGKFKGKSYRRIAIWEDQIDGIRTESFKEVLEIDQSGAARSLAEFNPRLNKPTIERIRYGTKRYVREGAGKWKEESNYTSEDAAKWREAAGQGEPATRPKVIDGQKEYKFFGFEMLNGQKVSVGGFVGHSKIINPVDNSETFVTSTFKVWFGEREMILKTENFTERKKGEKTNHHWQTEIYELDPNIKIQAPAPETF